MFGRWRARSAGTVKKPKKASARRRWLRRIAGALGSLFALAAIVVFALLHNLDHPWVKSRVQRLVHEKTGVDIEYGAVRVALLHGLELHDVVVRMPLPQREIAPELARVGKIEARWSTALFTGNARRIDHVLVSDVALTVIVDEHGATSFDLLSAANPGPPSPPSPSTPHSRIASDLLLSARDIPTVDIGNVAATLVRTETGVAVEHVALQGVTLHAAAEDAAGEWHLRANLGSPSAPLDLVIARDQQGAPKRDAHARVWLTTDLTATDLNAVLNLELPSQSFVKDVDVTHMTQVAHAEAHAKLDSVAKKIDLTIDHTFVADGVVTVEAAIELPDEGAPLVEHALGDVDFARLLPLIPPALMPVHASVAKGQLHYRVEHLSTATLPKLSDGARVAIDADFADVKVAREEHAIDLAVDSGKLAVHVEPSKDASLKATAALTLEHAQFAAGAVNDLALDVAASQAKDGALSGDAELRFLALEMKEPKLAAQKGKVGLQFAKLVVDPAAPLTTRGDVTLTTDLASLDLRASTRATFDNLALHVHTKLAGNAPYAIDADARARELRLFNAKQGLFLRVPWHVDANVESAFPDLQHLVATRGVGHVVLDAGDVHAQVDATKAADAVDFVVASNVATLEVVRPFLAPDLAKKIPLQQIAVALRSKGHVDGVASSAPAINEHTEIDLANPAFEKFSAHALKVALNSKGTALQHTFDGDFRFDALTLAGPGSDASNDHVALRGAIDRTVPSFHLAVDTDGRALAKMKAELAFDRARRAITYNVETSVAHLSPLEPILKAIHGAEGVDLSNLDVALTARGAVLGVATSVGNDGSVHLEPAPEKTATLEGALTLHANHVGFGSGDVAFSTPAIALAADLHADERKRTVDGHIEMEEFKVGSGPHEFSVAGFSDHVTVGIEGDLSEPELELTQETALHVVRQDVAPKYPVGDVALTLAIRRGKDDVIHVSKLEVDNNLAGTKVAVRGAVDLSENQQRLSLHGDLHQDLARLSNAPDVLSATGNADVALRVESPDLSIFRAIASVKIQKADLRLPKSGVVVQGADGEVPISVSFRVGKRGMRLIREDQDNPYSALRFADQHPLLSRSSFISIHSLTLPDVSISPLVGNLQIEQNIISLRQFEMGIRDGRVTGQCALDWNGENSTIDMHVRADGVKSSHGEPFTGSAALVISAREHSIEGRADILQIGARHLLDLLDIQDPFHADAAINRIRSALRFGYPDRLRLTFDHGFASVHVAFGGLAGLVSVGDLRGIPIGPLIDQLIIPLLPKENP